jgi:hypothetical protein
MGCISGTARGEGGRGSSSSSNSGGVDERKGNKLGRQLAFVQAERTRELTVVVVDDGGKLPPGGKELVRICGASGEEGGRER